MEHFIAFAIRANDVGLLRKGRKGARKRRREGKKEKGDTQLNLNFR